MLVRARTWVCWQRKSNCNRKAIFTSRTRSPQYSVDPRLSCYSSNGLIHFIFSIYTICNTPLLTASPRSQNAVECVVGKPRRALPSHFPLLFWGWAKQTHLFLPEKLAGERRCDRYYRCLHFTVKGGAGPYGHCPCKTIVVFIEAGSFPFSFPSSSQREISLISCIKTVLEGLVTI